MAADHDIRVIILSSDPWFDGSIIEAGNNIHLKCDLSLDALHDSQDLLMRTVLSAFAHGEEIKETRFPVLLPKSGFKNQRVLQIGSRDIVRACRRYPAVPPPSPSPECGQNNFRNRSLAYSTNQWNPIWIQERRNGNRRYRRNRLWVDKDSCLLKSCRLPAVLDSVDVFFRPVCYSVFFRNIVDNFS